jgi:alcohol dehydrogenase
MRAVVYDGFGEMPEVRQVADPVPPDGGAVIRVAATGLCRSDWYGWQGHDDDIAVLPHVPGHEFAGVVEAVGAGVTEWRPGDRITVPFVCACGKCAECASGNQQVCERQTQPGFHHWGSFAEYVAVDAADVNLVAIPQDMAYATAASLGCRFATAYRAVTAQARVRPGEWVAVFGCGGVGLSAVMIAAAAGARVLAADISPAALDLAVRAGAEATVRADDHDVAAQIRDLTQGGTHVSVDAIGSPQTCAAGLDSLRRRGRHIQVGLLPPLTPVALGRLISQELQLIGSHGMAAHDYPPMLAQITSGTLHPQNLITRTISLEDTPTALTTIGSHPGITVIEP